MTYLELINGVLRRLREREVTSADQTTYSTMVGDYVNDAKRLVEGRWNWSSNRSTIPVTTADGTDVYALPGFGQDGRLLTAYNSTSKWHLSKKPQAWFDRQDNLATPVSSTAPVSYCFRGVDSNKDSQVQLWPVPDGVYTLNFEVFSYQGDLASNATEIQIPALPVLHLAVAMLAEEKGEAMGLSSARYFEMADKFLGDAIAIDAAKNSEELQWISI